MPVRSANSLVCAPQTWRATVSCQSPGSWSPCRRPLPSARQTSTKTKSSQKPIGWRHLAATNLLIELAHFVVCWQGLEIGAVLLQLGLQLVHVLLESCVLQVGIQQLFFFGLQLQDKTRYGRLDLASRSTGNRLPCPSRP